jgi:protein TonB
LTFLFFLWTIFCVQTSEKRLLTSNSSAETCEELEQASSGSEVNEYLAKIQAIVYQHFNVPPNTQGQSAKAVIELDALGRMTDFRVLSYSSSEALNKEVDKIKERLKNVVFQKIHRTDQAEQSSY